MKLSEHFNSTEFACRCGCGFETVDPALVEGLELLRLKLGAAVRITSGCRCLDRNREVGGSPASQHLYGRAADIVVPYLTGDELYKYARTIPAFSGFGVGGGFLHVDVRTGAVARWRYDREGRVIAWPETRTA